MPEQGGIYEKTPVEVWQPALDCRTRWTIQRGAGSGGQGRGYVVSRTGDEAATPYFLKELKDQSNPQRRARLFREAAALESYAHPRIPRLVESNAHLHGDRTAHLYLVTEFISGETLANRHRKPLVFDDAIDLTDQLAETVAYLQTNDAVHRDIKPDNVILRHGEIDAVLVDFGLAFNQSERAAQLTGDWEELGNRFLRVPELASYSVAKQDARTDIAFLAGILFYCLVGEVPAVLEDAEGRLPHQRIGIDLAAVAPDAARIRALGRFFDRGFQPRLNDRFPTIAAFRDALSALRHPSAESPDYMSILMRAGRLREGDEAARYRRRSEALKEVWHWMDKNARAIQVATGGTYVVTCSGDYDPGTDHPYRNFGLHHHHRAALQRFWLKATCHFIGPELIVTIANEDGGHEEEVLRTAIEDPNFDFAGDQVIQTRLVIGLEGLPPA